MTTIRPALHIFPAVEQPAKRRESLDDLIQRSMDLRPTGPWQQKQDFHVRSRDRSRGRRSPSPFEVHTIGLATSSSEAIRPEDFYNVDRLQRTALPLLQTTGMSTQRRNMSMSPSRRRPRRCPSASRSRRCPSPAPMTAPMMTQGAVQSIVSSINQSPISPADSNSSARGSQHSSASTEITVPDRSATSSRASNRKHVGVPLAHGQPIFATVPATTNEYPELNPNTFAVAGAVPPQDRYLPSRSSDRSHVAYAEHIDQRRVVSPAPSEQTIVASESCSLSRTASVVKRSHFSPITPDETSSQTMQSVFPMYNPRQPVNRLSCKPKHIAPLILSSEKVSRPEYSPNLLRQVLEPPKAPVEMSEMADLEKLWNCTNGQIITLEPKMFGMKMFRPSKGAKHPKINFGPSESTPFFSLSQSNPHSDDRDKTQEVLIFRHSMTSEDILPICHTMLDPPPAPTLSKVGRSAPSAASNEPAIQVTKITPILATLHSLDHAAKTPQAHTLALVDPRATSPAAARLAERAVADAIARESSTLSWTKTSAQRGKYELHHPSLGVFTVVAEGDIATGFTSGTARGATSISILNPFASISASTFSSPTKADFGSTTKSDMAGVGAATPVKDDVLARLDLVNDTLELDAAAIQQLGNIYLIDVCVSVLLCVAVAEAQRPADPGLVFAAPPLSPFANPNASKKDRKKAEEKTAKAADAAAAAALISPMRDTFSGSLVRKKNKKRQLLTTPGADMSLAAIEHLVNTDDLPRITRGILSVLGFSFKTAVWILSLGVRLTASLVVGVSRLAEKA